MIKIEFVDISNENYYIHFKCFYNHDNQEITILEACTRTMHGTLREDSYLFDVYDSLTNKYKYHYRKYYKDTQKNSSIFIKHISSYTDVIILFKDVITSELLKEIL